MNPLITKAEKGFRSLGVSQSYVKNAIGFLRDWLNKDEYKNYIPQIEHLIENSYWDYLLDSFYQVIPFGTSGRRGEVGVGPNRINPQTVMSSAQGHAQYLLKKYGDEAKNRGIVFTYDVREFFGNKYLKDNIKNPVKNLTSRDLAITATGVYSANGIKVRIFDDVRTTPELSFAVRYLNACAGVMFSASHNPPDHNGKKVYDEFGGQLIPPQDEELVTEVTERVKKIKEIPYDEAFQMGLVEEIDSSVDEAYIKAATDISLSKERGIKIVYTPLHGCGMTSVYKALKNLGFDVLKDPKTANPSGKFENVTFNIPNPEVLQSFDTTLAFAKQKKADIILNSDPDADRIGIMVKHKKDWIFVNGNEIGAILAEFIVQKKKEIFKGNEVMVKTTVTTNLLEKICQKNDIELIGELLIGFKFIADEMNKLEKDWKTFLLGCEESHGYLGGTYARDKDAISPAIWLSELAAELKKEGKTLIDYLNQIYCKYGYFKNYVTEIRMLGASGKEKIDRIQASLRSSPPKNFGEFKIKKIEDCRDRKPILSETDKSAKDVLIFHLEAMEGAESIKVTIRPSGTEPKIKMYFEIGTRPADSKRLNEIKKNTEGILRRLEKSVMQSSYKIIGIDFPERGFLLFWQLPLQSKLQYFILEPKIAELKNIKDKNERKGKLSKLISFLGSNPVEKIDEAFKAKYKTSLLNYLNL